MSTRTGQATGRPNVGTERSLSLRGETKDANVSLCEDEVYAARLEVEHDGTTWRYGVDDDRRVTFLDARDRDGRIVNVDEPDWMYDVFLRIGVEDR